MTTEGMEASAQSALRVQMARRPRTWGRSSGTSGFRIPRVQERRVVAVVEEVEAAVAVDKAVRSSSMAAAMEAAGVAAAVRVAPAVAEVKAVGPHSV